MTTQPTQQEIPLLTTESPPPTKSLPQPTISKDMPVSNLSSHPKEYKWQDRLGIVSAAELKKQSMDREFELDFLPFLGQQGFIPKTYSCILAGYPKTGKTELTTQLVLEWADNNESILYISEESQIIWRERLRTREGRLENILIYAALGVSQNQVQEAMEKSDASIVVIDTIRSLLCLDDENDNSKIAKALNPLISASRKNGQTIIFLHHTRKGGGQYGEGISGGHAFLGSVDIFLELHRDSKIETRRLITGAARIIRVPEILYELDDQTQSFISIGSPEELSMDSVCKRLLENCLTNEWIETSKITERLDNPIPKHEQLRLALNKLAVERKIDRSPNISEGSKPGKTYRWKLPVVEGGENHD